MQRLVFWLVYPFLWIISKFPFWLFYKVSDLIFFIVYYLVGYRRKTVIKNLKLALPNKSETEYRKISKGSFKHMCDMFLEMVKSISIPNNELKRRYTFSNISEIQRIRELNKSIILICGHYASYEWINALQLYGLDYRGYGIYKKVQNPHFDKMAKDIRQRFDGELITSSQATATIKNNQQKGILGVYAIVADQSPKLGRAKTWTKFMGTTVPIFMGSEKLAKNLDMAVLYLHVEKKARGFYEATFVPITDNAAEEPDFKITNTFLTELEKQIKEKPEYYLWTHKRWKHKDAPIPKDAKVFPRT
ncbi:lysophospholipid acyltransferase family protein [Gillisia marina]|uniref:lysophospholipid acyltransferase family protein n=1 Tax=Gillisia marina TaxID=1167637 RepID=UPI00029A0502|nr:lipid A biosynthesis acyltransferase [Gillisia marina]